MAGSLLSRITSIVKGTIVDLSVVIPVYDEADNLPELYRRLSDSLGAEDCRYELVFVNDGSADATPQLLEELRTMDARVTIVTLSRNFGHQAAITAGLRYACGRAVILMDGDLQDPPEVLTDFIATWQRGYDVVYAVRTKRKESAFKRLGYFAFYRMLRAISELNIPIDSGDFCLMDRRVVDALNTLPEQGRFVRGLRTFVGFKQIGLEYERAARAAGRPKYTMRALIRLAVDGLISFSSYPLHLATYCGLAAIGMGFIVTIWVLVDAMYRQSAPRGWASTLVILMFMGAVQLLSLGIIGEYIRRIFVEAKQRPAYIIDSVRQTPAAAMAMAELATASWDARAAQEPYLVAKREMAR